jgi:hypothetical protein
LEIAQPLYKLYGKPESLQSHINEDPGDHNFGLDNRLAYYRMVGEHFFANQKFSAEEDPALSKEVKTAEELNIPLPDGNVDFNSLALKLAESLPGNSDVSNPAEREKFIARLKTEILRWPQDDFTVNNGTTETSDGVTITRRTMRFGGSWSVPIVELSRGKPKSTAIVLADAGRKSISDSIVNRLEQGEGVIAVDPFYFGESALGKQDFLYGLFLSSVGDRPLGIQAAQIAAVAKWAVQEKKSPVRLESFGPRTGLIALCAAVSSEAITDLTAHDALKSLKDVLKQNKAVNEAPDLFTFGLLEFADIPQLTAAFGKPIKTSLKE